MTEKATDYKATLNLPKTDFAMKADLPHREPKILGEWESRRLYEAIQRARQGAPKFVLHDGPPYANGDIHIGHALNKILKDMIVRYKTMRGLASPYVPGWDCHGMPIEHQLFKELKLTKHQIPQLEFRHKARAYAEQYVGIQREQFKRLGVSGDWEHPYLTLSKDYEAAIIRTFNELVKQGYIYRGRKPVYWCASCETALAEAEVEYEDRQDTSIYVKFRVDPDELGKISHGMSGAKDQTFLIVWTTTPWTLPANVAAAFHPEKIYRYVELENGEAWVIAEDRVNDVLAKAGVAIVPGKGWVKPGVHFSGVHYLRPFIHPMAEDSFTESRGRVVTDEFVSIAEGTGIVHIAPGHGQEDYSISQRCKLEVLSPIDERGQFTKEAGEWAGQTVWDANPRIIDDLRRRGLLVHEASIIHSYPHCWRCKNPVIFRATPQWFLKVDDALREKLLEAAKTVQWIPEAGLSRMRGMLEHRPDWCLSRQRYWGVPIPVLRCAQCDEALLDATVLDQIEQRLAQEGTDLWFTATPEELAPGARCPKCQSTTLSKESDILDVWFDSGVSHEAVLKPRPNLAWPASMYLEGSDQHRGWFQVSLIPSVALHGRPPYDSVLTHGFVMDGEGRKMSKSLGNVVAPQQVIQRYGADVLRLWVASCDYSEDVRISDAILERIAEAYRKIRNTFRYLLANLYDFRPTDAQPAEAMPEIDRWALQRIQRLTEEVTAAYDGYQFHQAFRAISTFCVLDLSAFYLDALKDRLYTEPASSPKRRCAQTVLYVILGRLVALLAPVLAMTAEDVWQSMRSLKLVDDASVHVTLWPNAEASRRDEALVRRWDTFLAVREVVMKALEQARTNAVIGSPLEARVTLVVRDRELGQRLETARETLEEAFVVSEVSVLQVNAAQAGSGDVSPMVPGLVRVQVTRASGAKCQRCWKYRLSVGESSEHPSLCARCAAALSAA